MRTITIGDLSRTEWKIMKICWEKGQSTAKVVYEESLKEKKRRYVTVKTMLDRLVEKEYLEREKFGPVWLYKPIVSEKKATSYALNDFIKVVLGNKTTPILKHIADIKKYDINIKELKQLIDKLESGG